MLKYVKYFIVNYYLFIFATFNRQIEELFLKYPLLLAIYLTVGAKR